MPTESKKRILNYEQAEACRAAISFPGHDFIWCPYSLRENASIRREVRCNYFGKEDYAFNGARVIERCHSPHAQTPAKCPEPIVIDFQAARAAKEKTERKETLDRICHLADHIK